MQGSLIFARITVLGTLAAAAGCAGLIAAMQPPPPQPIAISYKMPVIAPVPGAVQQAQAKAGITIIATPATYVETTGTQNDEVETGRGVSCAYVKPNWNVTPVRHLKVTHTPKYGVDPDRVVFQVKISNQMSRVFRGAGAVVQFNVAGHLVSVGQAQYADLTNLILPPRNEADIRIVGPPLSTVPDNSTIGLFIYDVVTNTDAAGNVTQKQNYEWFYNYKTETVSRQGIVATESRDEALGPATRKARCE